MQNGGLDSSYHVQINVSVKKGIIWGISIHNIHKGEVWFFPSAYILERQVRITKYEKYM